MADLKPNHKCKACGKLYYDLCTNTKSWRSVACSKECYDVYVNRVIEARSKGKKVDMMPERTDMTKEEVVELLNMPTEVALEKAKEELKDYANEDGSVDFAEAIQAVNAEIEKKSSNRYRNKKKVSENEDNE